MLGISLTSAGGFTIKCYPLYDDIQTHMKNVLMLCFIFYSVVAVFTLNHIYDTSIVNLDFPDSHKNIWLFITMHDHNIVLNQMHTFQNCWKV